MSAHETPLARIAVISLHTSPLDQPGAGDSGGMNVEIRELAKGLGDAGVAVDVFTRCAGRGVPEIEPLGPMARVIQVPAGPCADVAKLELLELIPTTPPSSRSRARRSSAAAAPSEISSRSLTSPFRETLASEDRAAVGLLPEP